MIRFCSSFLHHEAKFTSLLSGVTISVGVIGLPDEVSQEMLQDDDDFLQLFHHALLEVTLEEGALICPETGRKFPVSKGIPNLLLHEDEC